MFYNFNKKKVFFGAVLAVLFLAVFTGGFFVGKNQVVCKACKPENIDFSLFWDAYNKLKENFINPEEVNDQEIIYGAIWGMTKSLGDPYTDFLNPEQAKLFKQDLLGSFDGIGAEVGLKKNQLTIIAPLKGTPSEKAGLKAGDQIVKINGKSSFDMSIEEAVSLIRGKKGTKVTLTIFREGWNQTKDIEVIRNTIKVEAISWEPKGNVAYMHINQFNQLLPYDFKKVALEILKSPVDRIVLDLRNNPGGYLEVCQDIAGWFLKKGQVVTIEDFGLGREQKQYKANGTGAFADYPLVVLIDGGSASAAEILAGALRDNRKVKLIGEKSFGKGSVQEVINLQDGESFLKITVAKWLTPKGSLISEIGLNPDVEILANRDEIKNGQDLQLEKALEIIGQIP